MQFFFKREWISLQNKHFLLPAVLCAICAVLIQLIGSINYLSYQRNAIINGAIWRMITGQLTHVNWSHLLMNLSALALIVIINSNTKLTINWWRITFICLWSVGLGLLIFNPEVLWYVGLSGLIHGWFTAGIIILFRTSPSKIIYILLLLLIKLVYEKLQNPANYIIGSDIIIISASHWYGALSGIISGLLENYLFNPKLK